MEAILIGGRTTSISYRSIRPLSTAALLLSRGRQPHDDAIGIAPGELRRLHAIADALRRVRHPIRDVRLQLARGDRAIAVPVRGALEPLQEEVGEQAVPLLVEPAAHLVARGRREQ